MLANGHQKLSIKSKSTLMHDTFIPPLQGAVTAGPSNQKKSILNQKEKGEMTLEELIRQYRQNKSNLKSWDSESSSWFVSSEEEDNNCCNEVETRKEYIPLYRKEHGGIIIYDCDGNIPGQPGPKYDDSDYDDANWINEENDQVDDIEKHEENLNETVSQIQKDIDIWSPVIELKRHGENRWKSVNIDDNTAVDCPLIDESQILSIKLRTNRTKNKDGKEENYNDLKMINLDKNHICRWRSEFNITTPLELICEDEEVNNTIKKKKIEKIYGMNETPPDLRLLNKRPKFTENFQSQIMSKITPKRRYGNPNHNFTLKMPPEEELKVRFESRFENGNLK